MRRKAQGAIEYLFMIAAALIIIAIVLKYLRGAGESTGEVVNQSASKLTELVNQSIQNATK
ncbi:class III signal peptide-containing protein [Thermococcus sp. M39]|uniref:class III signal peptide-containing protein n=1 Tax=unclassified Thermococcus TaxID=2627626 RepID=UPI001430EFF7|nr:MULTISPECIES: class III signal peptide-containing protein [unclassified Thermococcus]NJE07779.1 class III signal peptide-containing protein [Thermococcus sp. M39]NJE12334.1 class III signal peptide-containing protein [Thermococcus sp. LS2]NJE77448.1 class III signal peptide-containing protein [Thermococcus sp. ES12]